MHQSRNAYRLGILKYDDANKNFENGSLLDNKTGQYSYMPYDTLQWVPYDNGYYVQVAYYSFSEFWFTTRVPQTITANTLVYPNPVKDGQFNILWTAMPGDNMNITIYDVAGRKVLTTKVTANDYDNHSIISLPPLLTGVYLLRYTTGNETKEEKLIVP